MNDVAIMAGHKTAGIVSTENTATLTCKVRNIDQKKNVLQHILLLVKVLQHNNIQ